MTTSNWLTVIGIVIGALSGWLLRVSSAIRALETGKAEAQGDRKRLEDRLKRTEADLTAIRTDVQATTTAINEIRTMLATLLAHNESTNKEISRLADLMVQRQRARESV